MPPVHEEDRSTYYMEQLCTIGISAVLGGVALLLWVSATYFPPARGQQSMLTLMLAPKFHLPVLLGGIALLSLAVTRAVTLFLTPGQNEPHGCCHEEEACGRHHEDAAVIGTAEHLHNNGHEHEHEHGWTPWRYAVLLLPAVLYGLGMPAHGFSNLKAEDVSDIEEWSSVGQKDDRGLLGFKDLDGAAYIPAQRGYYEGHIGRLRGQLTHSTSDTKFSLVRFKMTCCAADAKPIRVVIVAPFGVSEIPELQWVEVKGQIQFRKRHGGNDYVPVLQVQKPDDIRAIDPEPDLYIQ